VDDLKTAETRDKTAKNHRHNKMSQSDWRGTFWKFVPFILINFDESSQSTTNQLLQIKSNHAHVGF